NTGVTMLTSGSSFDVIAFPRLTVCTKLNSAPYTSNACCLAPHSELCTRTTARSVATDLRKTPTLREIDDSLPTSRRPPRQIDIRRLHLKHSRYVPIVNHRICIIGDPQGKVVLCRKQIERLNFNVDVSIPGFHTGNVDSMKVGG